MLPRQLKTGSSTIETKHLLLLLLLCGDVAVNPGPTNFGFINCRSIHSKGPLLHDLIQCSDLDILGLVEIQVRPTDTNGLLNSVTPLNYNLIKKPRCTGLAGGVGFLCRKSFSPSIVSSPVFRSFKIIILSFRSNYNSFVAACVYHPPVLVLPNFWKIFWFFLAFCLQLVPISSFVVTYMFIWMLSVAILQCCSLSQCVSGPTHILGHTLDVLISPCDSDFVRNVNV